ncbi:hypothetical protein P9222_20465 [Paenibacillus amylolyticus]|nr:hypothetical protein [Paenibacillus amylolyticus]WFR60904.1 hypothetical protein P9222_20465 [Paenibacillus amylolyticus]
MTSSLQTISTLITIAFLAPNLFIKILADNKPKIEPNVIPNMIQPTVFVREGEVEYWVGEEKVRLQCEEGMFINSRIIHGYTALQPSNVT